MRITAAQGRYRTRTIRYSRILFYHHIRIDFAHSPFALGLDNLEVAGDARPRIVESLVGIVPVDERDTREGVAEPLCDIILLGHGINLR